MTSFLDFLSKSAGTNSSQIDIMASSLAMPLPSPKSLPIALLQNQSSRHQSLYIAFPLPFPSPLVFDTSRRPSSPPLDRPPACSLARLWTSPTLLHHLLPLYLFYPCFSFPASCHLRRTLLSSKHGVPFEKASILSTLCLDTNLTFVFTFFYVNISSPCIDRHMVSVSILDLSTD